jgi:putative transposase
MLDWIQAILIQRQAVYEQARAKNPMRWSGHTRNWQMIEEVHLNPTKDVLVC